jgi:hypothetical protein
MFEVYLADVALLNAGFQQASKQDQLLIIAIFNAIAWVGILLFMLWQLHRRSKSVEDRISRLESSIPKDEPSSSR